MKTETPKPFAFKRHGADRVLLNPLAADLLGRPLADVVAHARTDALDCKKEWLKATDMSLKTEVRAEFKDTPEVLAIDRAGWRLLCAWAEAGCAKEAKDSGASRDPGEQQQPQAPAAPAEAPKAAPVKDKPKPLVDLQSLLTPTPQAPAPKPRDPVQLMTMALTTLTNGRAERRAESFDIGAGLMVGKRLNMAGENVNAKGFGAWKKSQPAIVAFIESFKTEKTAQNYLSACLWIAENKALCDEVCPEAADAVHIQLYASQEMERRAKAGKANVERGAASNTDTQEPAANDGASDDDDEAADLPAELPTTLEGFGIGKVLPFASKLNKLAAHADAAEGNEAEAANAASRLQAQADRLGLPVAEVKALAAKLDPVRAAGPKANDMKAQLAVLTQACAKLAKQIKRQVTAEVTAEFLVGLIAQELLRNPEANAGK